MKKKTELKIDAGERRQEILDGQITEALHRRAGLTDISSDSTRQMKQRIFNQIEEESTMKHWNIKKTVLLAAAICLAGSITAVAAGKVAYSISGSNLQEAVYDYSQVADLGHKQGLTVKAPQQFENGYRFASANPGEGSNQDESGATLSNWKSLDVVYEKSGMPKIFMGIKPVGSSSGDSTPDQTFQVGEITLNFSSTANLSVPPDYEVSAEDLKLQEEGKLNIAYGSSSVERQQYKYMSWKDGGNHYYLGSFDNSMPADDFAKMAEAIIHSK